MILKKFNDEINVSQLVLGMDVFGSSVCPENTFPLLDYYTQNGGTTIDTARLYGINSAGEVGMSEETIGKWLKSRGCRDKYIISTKCAHPPVGNMSQSRLSPEEIEDDIDHSLIALKTDYIDILWLHRDDVNLNVSGIIDTLNNMIKKGKIRSYGGSNWSAKRFYEANEYAQSTGQIGFSGSQLKYSAAITSPDFNDDPTLLEMNTEQYNYYKDSKMSIFAYASQAKGFFYKYDAGGEAALSVKAKERYLCDENINRYNKLKDFCHKKNVGLITATLCALTSNTDFQTSAIIGCSSISQLEACMKAADSVLDYNELKEIIGY